MDEISDYEGEDMQYEQQHIKAKRTGLDSTNSHAINDWTSAFLSNHTTQSSKLPFDDVDVDVDVIPESPELKSKANELTEVLFTEAPSSASRSTLTQPTSRTRSSLLHSEHIKPPPTHPEGVSFSQPLPDDDFDYMEHFANVDDDASTASDCQTNASTESSQLNEPFADDSCNERDQLAANLYQRLVRLSSSPAYHYSQYHFVLGVLKMQRGDFEGAVASFRQADQLFTPFADPDDTESCNSYQVEVHTALATAIVSAAVESARHGEGDDETLRSAIAQSQAILTDVQSNMNGTSVEVWNEICLLLINSANLSSALQLYEILVGAFPRSEDLQSNLAACTLLAGDIESAASLLQSTLTNHPSHVASLINYASVLSSQSKHSCAVNFLRLAIEIDQSSFHAWNNLAVQYQMMAESEKATVCFEAATSIVRPSTSSETALSLNIATNLLSRARTETNVEQKHRMIASCRQLLSSSSEPRSLSALADCHQILGESVEAMQQYDLALNMDPACFEALNGRGLLLLSQFHVREAELMFTRAISSINPTSPLTAPVMMNCATTLLMQRRFSDAKLLMETALQLAETQRSTDQSRTTLQVLCGCLSMLGSINRKLNDLLVAEQYYERCLELDSNRVDSLNGLALVYADGGKYDKADQLLEQVVNLPSASPADINAAQHNRDEIAKRRSHRSQ